MAAARGIRLVVNADDLGLHPDIDAGILRAHREGILTSASVLVKGTHAEVAVRRAREQGLALGVHLCLSTRLPPAASEVETVAPDGRMRATWAGFAAAWLARRVRGAEVAREWRAQVRCARELGFEPDHLDVHQHLHLLPGLGGIVRELSAETRLAVRWPRERPTRAWVRSPGAMTKSLLLGALAGLPFRAPRRSLPAMGVFESGALDEQALLGLIDRLEEGDHELVCHPGGAEGIPVPEDPGWRYGWRQELTALCSPAVRERVRARRIELTTWGALFAA